MSYVAFSFLEMTRPMAGSEIVVVRNWIKHQSACCAFIGAHAMDGICALSIRLRELLVGLLWNKLRALDSA